MSLRELTVGHLTKRFISCLVLSSFVVSPLTSIAGVSSVDTARSEGKFERPPQFVMLAFDGSKSIPMWQETREFAKANNVKFTYFISGVYFLSPSSAKMYQAPGHGPGHSDIGFGVSREDIQQRIVEVNKAFTEGAEMASHVNGHYDGSHWTQMDWESEFSQFTHLVFDVFTNNNLLRSAEQLANRYFFGPEQITGFRAPLLGVSEGLWPALQENHFRYDTSRVDKMNYWPTRIGGLWNFPLAALTIAGTSKRTLSMDYNFYYAQSQGKEDVGRASLYEEQMYETYMAYFMNNYNGNRAPIHIGHHFSKWNGGAYWAAMKRVASQVCSLPEVRCVTYKELADYMDGLTPRQITAYQAGDFAKGSPITFPLHLGRPLKVDLKVSALDDGGLKVTGSGDDKNLLDFRNARLEWSLDEDVIEENAKKIDFKSFLKESSENGANGDKSRISVKFFWNEREVTSTTHAFDVDEDSNISINFRRLEDGALVSDPAGAHEPGEQ